jgi:hypothetical protein
MLAMSTTSLTCKAIYTNLASSLYCSLLTSVTHFFCHSFFRELAVMTPTYNNGAMRVLISVLLASSVANAVALPHQVLDTRDPAPIQNVELAADAFQAAASAAAKNPTNFFEEISDKLNHRTAWEVFRDYFIRLFGPRDDDDDDNDYDDADTTTTTTVYVTPTGGATLSVDIILPPGPFSTPTEVVSIIPSTSLHQNQTFQSPPPLSLRLWPLSQS